MSRSGIHTDVIYSHASRTRYARCDRGSCLSANIESGLERCLKLGLRAYTLERIALKCPDEFTAAELQCARWKLQIRRERHKSQVVQRSEHLRVPVTLHFRSWRTKTMKTLATITLALAVTAASSVAQAGDNRCVVAITASWQPLMRVVDDQGEAVCCFDHLEGWPAYPAHVPGRHGLRDRAAAAAQRRSTRRPAADHQGGLDRAVATMKTLTILALTLAMITAASAQNQNQTIIRNSTGPITGTVRPIATAPPPFATARARSPARPRGRTTGPRPSAITSASRLAPPRDHANDEVSTCASRTRGDRNPCYRS